MKRVLHILGILSMAFFLGACGKKENIVTETPTISVVHSSYAIDVDSYAALAGSADYVTKPPQSDERLSFVCIAVCASVM